MNACRMNQLLLSILSIMFVTSTLALYSSLTEAGSLYHEEEYDSLVSDKRSYKVGDILSVMIYESATATTTVESETSKSSSIGAKASDGTTSFKGDIGITSDFDGGGTSNQTGKLVATVSVTILDKMPNGDMKINGEQSIEFNNDMQFISVSGVVREEDISTNNTILSTRIADSKIKFVGEGLVSSRSKPGVFTRIWNWLF